MNDQMKILVRSPEPEDKDFIMSTWLKGNRYGSNYFELQDAGAYYREHGDKITKTLIHPDTWIRVACGEEDLDWIVGFCAFKNDALYWVYVRDGYRKKGIAKLLLNGVKINKIKGISKIGAAIAKKKGLIFEPL